MHVLIVNFQLNGLSPAAYAALAAQRAPHFAAMPGLISKVWLADPAANVYGGVYLWASRAALDAYLASETFNALAGNPAFTGVNARIFDTLPEPTAVSAAALTAHA